MLTSDHFADLNECQEQGRDAGKLSCARMNHAEEHSPDIPFTSGSTIAKMDKHSVLECKVGFLGLKFFVEYFVHSFCFLMGLAAVSAFDEMGVQGAAFFVGKLVVQIGRQKFVDVVVNGHNCSEARAGLSCLRIEARARPRIPRSDPLVRPSRFSMVA